MFFKKKSNNFKCPSCRTKIEGKFNFCPYCGNSLMQEDENDFGVLGKKDISDNDFARHAMMSTNLGAMDKLLSSMVNGLMKSLISDSDKNNKNVQNIKIKIGIPNGSPQLKEKKVKTKTVSQEMINKISSLPREKANSSIKRINDKLIYELNIPGISSPENIFVSRLESGYEIKAIGQEKEGKEKVYVNSLPVTLPIKSFTINPDKLLIEFNSKDE